MWVIMNWLSSIFKAAEVKSLANCECRDEFYSLIAS